MHTINSNSRYWVLSDPYLPEMVITEPEWLSVLLGDLMKVLHARTRAWHKIVEEKLSSNLLLLSA